MRKLFYIAVAVTGLGACAGDQVVAPNLNNPDVSRVLARPSDLESVIGNSFGSAYASELGSTSSASAPTGGIEPAMLTMAFENSSSLANDAMGPRGSIPRAAIANNSTDTYAGNNAYNYQGSQRAARTAANGLVQLNLPNYTLGSKQQDLRARAFAFFAMGFANATAAMAYDSLSVVSQTDTIGKPPTKFVGGVQAMPAILTQMDSAVAAANAAIALGSAPSGAGGGLGFTLPGTWVNGNAFTATQFIQMVRSFKARFRANVARTPEDRAAVDWAQVIGDATNGLPTDLNITMSQAPWRVLDEQHYLFDTWAQQSPMIIGMADSVRAGCSAANQGDPNTGNCYDAWLATALGSRYAFLIQTADLRFPQGATRATQQNNSGAGTAQQPPRTNLYFRNRRSSDPSGDPWTLSQYDFYRFQLWNDAGRTGPYPIMTRAEINLLAAEGYIRTGDFTNAMAMINKTRVTNGGLPPLVGITSATQPIATGVAANSCVPRVPTGPDFAHATCGNIFEAMKWEKRMETAYTHLGAWYLDSRGWGDLPQYTALDWPVPFQETDVRSMKSWTTGGAGGKDAAKLGSYGY